MRAYDPRSQDEGMNTSPEADSQPNTKNSYVNPMSSDSQAGDDKPVGLFCRVVFQGGKPIFIEKLNPFIPEVIDLNAYAERLATERELETVRYWHKQTIHAVPHPIDIRLTLHAQEDRIRELEYMLAATLTGKDAS